MRRRPAAIFLALLLIEAGPGAAGAAPACLGETFAATASEALDARSLRLSDGRVLRLAGLEPFSLVLADPAAAAAAEERLRSRLNAHLATHAIGVRLSGAKPDRYGRLSAVVLVGDVLLQETLAGEGLAIAAVAGAPPPCFDRMLAAEDAARIAQRGLWQEITLPAAEPEALRPALGRFAIFEGTIASVGTRRNASYLDFGAVWSQDVTIEIPAAARDAFGGAEAIEKLAGARIRARGFLQEKAGPMLTVRSPTQLQILAREAPP